MHIYVHVIVYLKEQLNKPKHEKAASLPMFKLRM